VSNRVNEIPLSNRRRRGRKVWEEKRRTKRGGPKNNCRGMGLKKKNEMPLVCEFYDPFGCKVHRKQGGFLCSVIVFT